MKKVGVFEAGYNKIELFSSTDHGNGAFWLCPKGDNLPRIEVGLDCLSFSEVISTLTHEIFEFLLTKRNKRYKGSINITSTHDGYVFMFTHDEFSEVCAEAGEFVEAARPALYKHWRKSRK